MSAAARIWPRVPRWIVRVLDQDIPTTIGTAFEGGFYTGHIRVDAKD